MNNVHAIKLMQNNTGTIISPYSITSAMNILALGLRGNTLIEMAKAFDVSPDMFELAIGDMFQSQMTMTRCTNTKIRVVNSIYIARDYPLIQKYLETVSKIGNIEPINFANGIDAQNYINQCIATNTEKLIPKLIPDGIINADTRLVITNALYFKGKWRNSFEKRLTKAADFVTLNGEKISINLMRQDTHQYSYYEDNKCQVVQLPYLDNFRMMVMLPKNNPNGPRDAPVMIDAITAISSCMPTKVRVYLPKFTQRSAISLIDTYQKMGVNDLFYGGIADMSGLTTQTGLYVSDILHGAVIIVDEEGTEAAAATAVVCTEECAMIENDPIIIRADHTFWYYILSPDDLIMFAGVYNGQ